MEEKKDKERLGTIIAILGGTIGVLSALYLIICKFISLGRVQYFEFDMEHFEYGIDYVSKGVLFFFLISVVIGGVCSAIAIYGGGWFKKKFTCELGYFIGALIIIIFLILTFFLRTYGRSYGTLVGGLTSIIFLFLYGMSYLVIGELGDNRKYGLAIMFLTIIVIIGGMSWLNKNAYDSAKEESVFAIIKENKVIDNRKYQYVVISTSVDKYSAYLCEIVEKEDGIELKIMQNVHKYFMRNETETFKVKFDKIEREELAYTDYF